MARTILLTFSIIIGVYILNFYYPTQISLKFDLFRTLVFAESVVDVTELSYDSKFMQPGRVVVHHDEILQTNFRHTPINEIYNFHISKFGKFMYHYYISESGTIFKLHQENTNINGSDIHICFSGNFDIEYPTPMQLRSYTNLKNHFTQKYNINIIGHRDISNKSCPGNNFRL